MLYLLSDLRLLWQAMQLRIRIGATSFMKLAGGASSAWTEKKVTVIAIANTIAGSS